MTDGIDEWFDNLEGWNGVEIDAAWERARELGDWTRPVDRVVECSFDEADLLRFVVSVYAGEPLLIDELPDGRMRLYSIGLNPKDKE